MQSLDLPAPATGRITISRESDPPGMQRSAQRADGAAADPSIEQEVLRAGVERLYQNSMLALTGAVVYAVVFWVLFFHHTGDPKVIAWAALTHTSQVARVIVIGSFRGARPSRRDPLKWLRWYRWTLFCSAVAWGLAPLMFMPPADLAYTAIMLLSVLGIATTGVSGIATDRPSIYLWFLPVAAPIPVALLLNFSLTNLALALGVVVFVAVNMRLMLAQNHVLRATLRAQFENAALVRRLNHQMELTAAASMEKSRFLASASHDLRQPLHALSFFGSTLERHLVGSPHQPVIFNMMRSIEALDKSFNAILDVSKLDSYAVEPHLQAFPLRDLFRRLQMSFGGQAEEACLHLRFSPGGRVVHSDPQLLERLLANLVQNALTYCRRGGVVLLARNCNGGTSIEVWDTGIGIPPRELPKVFGEFYQVANPERDRTKGLGIGLAIVARLTLLLDHRLTVRSRVGKGSVFKVWIRGSELGQMGEFTVPSETVPTRIDETRTVLFLDDEEAIRTSVSELLRHWGYTVLTAPTIAQARRRVLEHDAPINAIISDLRLGEGGDGIQGIEEIRQLCGYTVPALLVTGDTAPAQVKRIHESGHIVLFKPVQPKDLFSVLKRLLA